MTGLDIEVVPAYLADEVRSAARRAVDVLRAGGLIIHPTETVYGIGGDGSARSNELIARVKRRDPDRPLILLIPNIESLAQLVKDYEWSDDAQRLADRFWPGPLTLVVRCKEAARGLRGADGGVAVRVSSDPVIRAILAESGAPITSTSANLAGEAPATTASEAISRLRLRGSLGEAGVPVLALESGRAPAERPSTIVSLVEGVPRILRSGPLSIEELAAVLPRIEKAQGIDGEG